MLLENTKIGIIGGDDRQTVLARRLSEYGYEVAVWGLASGDVGGAVRCADFESALKKSSAVILPHNAFMNGKYTVTSKASGEVISLSQILFAMPKNAILLCGSADTVVSNSARDHDIEFVEYFSNEELQIKNAIPTAEGAVEIAMRELPITVNGAKILVCGYGRIGKILSAMLKNLGAKVYVSARRDSDLAYIEALGNASVRYGDESFYSAAGAVDVVFNTVPADIIDEAVISSMHKCKLIVDLASGKGGVDFTAAQKSGIKCIHALALPGKAAPITAGEILGDCIHSILLKKGVRPKQ